MILFVRLACIFMKVCFHLTDTINRFSYYSTANVPADSAEGKKRLAEKRRADSDSE